MCRNQRGVLCSTERLYRVKRREIAFVKFIFEAYEGIGTLSTIQPADGLIRIQIPPGCESVVEAVVEDLRKHIRIRSVQAPEGEQSLPS